MQTEHDDDREKQRNERDRRDARQKSLRVPIVAFHAPQECACRHPRNKGNTEIDEHAAEYRRHRNIDDNALKPNERRQPCHENPRIDTKEKHLKNAVEGNEPRCVLRTPLREIVPDKHHCDTSREANHDEAEHELWLVRQEQCGECEHQNRANNPILDERDREYFPIAKDAREFFVAHLRERRKHHQYEANRDRHVRGSNGHAIRDGRDVWDESPEQYACAHREKNPQREVAIEKRKSRGRIGRTARTFLR